MEEKYNVLGKILASKNRLNVILSLSEGLKTPSDISNEVNLHLSYVSKILGEFRRMNLAECKNPALMKGRIYGLTTFGYEIVEDINNLKTGKKEA